MERLIATFLVAFILMSACHKGTGNFVITGKVNDNTFQQGLVGATISCYKVPIGTADELFVASQNIAADGSYSFSVPREKMERYILKVSKANYFPIVKDIYYSQLSITTTNIFDLSTHAMAWAKIHLYNQNPSPLDQFRYIKQEGLAACNDCCPTTQQDFYGALDTTFYCINNGNTVYSIYYWELGTNNNGLKSTSTTAFDTTLIEVIY
ncbi:MAG: hypothetical protein RLZZ301_839 [Bacteroidota bacterium]|jgi:hypothetical protein